MQPRDLAAHVAYEAGRGAKKVARERGLDSEDLVELSSNENTFGPSPRAVEAVREHAPEMGAYPKAVATDLRECLAGRWGVDRAQVWLANGAIEAIDYLNRATLRPGESVLVPDPGFAYYSMSPRFHHGEVATYAVRRADGFAMDADVVMPQYDGERVVFLNTPHSPTGSEVGVEAVAAIADTTAPETLVVVDETYGKFGDANSATELLDSRDDVAVVRSFSKAYGLAGVRLGYALVPAAWADEYARVHTPFAASKLACRAGLAALEDDAHVDRTVETVRWARGYMRNNLACPTWDSAANFVLCDVGDGTAISEKAMNRGVLVRDTSSYGLPDCVRVTCGTREETERAVEVLNKVV